MTQIQRQQTTEVPQARTVHVELPGLFEGKTKLASGQLKVRLQAVPASERAGDYALQVSVLDAHYYLEPGVRGANLRYVQAANAKAAQRVADGSPLNDAQERA